MLAPSKSPRALCMWAFLAALFVFTQSTEALRSSTTASESASPSLTLVRQKEPAKTNKVIDPPTAAGLLKAAQAALEQEQRLFAAIQKNQTLHNRLITNGTAINKIKPSFLKRYGKKALIGAGVASLGLMLTHQAPFRQQKGSLLRRNTAKGMRHNLGTASAPRRFATTPIPDVEEFTDENGKTSFRIYDDHTRETFYRWGINFLPHFLQRNTVRGIVGIPLAAADSLHDIYNMIHATVVDPYHDSPFLVWEREKSLAHNMQHVVSANGLAAYVDEARARADMVYEETKNYAKAYRQYVKDTAKIFSTYFLHGELYDQEMQRIREEQFGEASQFEFPKNVNGEPDPAETPEMKQADVRNQEERPEEEDEVRSSDVNPEDFYPAPAGEPPASPILPPESDDELDDAASFISRAEAQEEQRE